MEDRVIRVSFTLLVLIGLFFIVALSPILIGWQLGYKLIKEKV